MTLRIVSAVVLILAGAGAAEAQDAAPIPTRTPLTSFEIAPAKAVARVDATRVDFAPGQAMPRHMHPVPVVCFAARGDFRYRIGDGPEQTAKQGTATLEPAGAVVDYFANGSATEPAELLCAVLAGPDDKTTSVMLPR
jgi:quercetin dioxygenase-like cupin family protein